MNPSEIVKRESLPPISMLRPLYHICRPFALASIDDNSCCLRHQFTALVDNGGVGWEYSKPRGGF